MVVGHDSRYCAELFARDANFLARTPRGRCATAGAYKHFGFTPPRSSEQPTMFDG